MDEADFEHEKERLIADRVTGRIGEEEYRRRLEDLLRSRVVPSLPPDSSHGSSADATTMMLPKRGLADPETLKPGEALDEYRLVDDVEFLRK